MKVQSVKRLLRIFWLLVLTSTPLLATIAAAAACATPGKDGVGSLSGVINSYYPGSGTASGTSLTLGAKSSGSAAANITAGDLILVMQMQDGSATDFSTAASYGTGTGTAGLYEYASVTGVAGSVITLASALTNTYIQSFANRQTFQVVRVPQYSSATVTGTLKAQTWTINASGDATGGVLALDVAGALALNANLDVSGQGFRGGGAANLTGNRIGGTIADLRYAQSTNNGASKGEGTAGTPASVFNGTSTYSTSTSTYTNGDYGRASPGNAGGGANDGQPDRGGNQYNAGGGGGGNAGAGGGGGLSWSLQNAAGGLGGKATAPSTTQLFLGGGGGAGGSNNNAEAVAVTTYPPAATGGGATGPITISGASGGGIVMVRSGTLSGSGQISADGYRAYNTSGGSEAAGAGGAGGSVMLNVSTGAASPAISVKGGAGGNSNYYHHGPGGGGGGGYVVTSTNLSPTITRTGGSAGVDSTTGAPGGYAVNADGAVVGTDGTASTVAPTASTLCSPVLTVTKVTSTPVRTYGTDTTATYSVTVGNSGGGVIGVNVTDVLPTPLTYDGAAVTPVYSGGASGPASLLGSGTTTAVFGTPGGPPANSFYLPQGGSVALSFTVNLGAAAPGTYQNPASVSFSDPTRTAAQTVSPGGTYTGGGAVGGSNYASASSTNEDVTINNPPTAVNDSAATNPGVSVTFSVTGNDTDTAPGTVNVTSVVFDPSSVGTITNSGKTLTVPGEGLYTANADGTVTFAPAVGFNSGASTAKYTVKDNNGAISNVATITVTVPASVDLGIVKTGPPYFRPGDTLVYTLTVTDTGSAASGVTVTDTLPPGLTFASASGGGTYNAATGKVSWTLGNVASGVNVVLTLTGTAPLAASVETNNGPVSLTNTAVTAANEPEVATANNSASTVSQLVYPKLSKRVRNATTPGAFGTTGTGKPGEVLEYCIDFRNYGVAVAGFVISDTVPGNTSADLSGYGAGLGLQVTRGGVTTRTSTGTDTDGGSLSAATLSLDLGILAAGESGSVCFKAGIR